MKTITKNQYLYLKSQKNAYLSKDETVTIEDEEFEDLIQYSNKQITPINNDPIEPEPIEQTPEEPIEPPIIEPEDEDPNHDYSQDYLTFEALYDCCQFYITNDNFQYSLDNGKTWNIINKDEWTPYINKGQKILWKQYGLVPNNGIGTYHSTQKYNVSGNIMSILFGDDFKNKADFDIYYEYNYLFAHLFEYSQINNAHNLILPVTVLSYGCYAYMFMNSSLKTAPKLVATTLAEFCYLHMFNSCSNLKIAPELPAKILTYNCYSGMFCGCISLIIAPELSSISLNESCYSYMFKGCESLITAPELPSYNLYPHCYKEMFCYCKSLTTAPNLPATSLKIGCYEAMFKGCESLITAPELYAKTLVTYCYKNMFYGCTSLNYIKCLLNNLDYNYLSFEQWTSNVYIQKYINDPRGIFIKLQNVNFEIGPSGIPKGWIVKELNPETMEVVNEYIAGE